MRFVVVPQAVRRVMPPLLNDFIGLQKDTALSVIGALKGFRRAKIYAGQQFKLPRHRARHLLRRDHVPDDPVHRLALRRDQHRLGRSEVTGCG